MMIYKDNQSTTAMCKNPQYHGRAKHIDIKHHFSENKLQNKNIVLAYYSTRDMAADMFTKGLAREQFCMLHSKIGIVDVDSFFLSK